MRNHHLRQKRGIRSLAVGLASATLLTACNTQNFDKPAEAQQFGQKVTYNKEVDVLIMVDTKSGMSEIQKSLADQMQGFIDSLNQTGLDYQIAVTTMDVSDDGEKGKFLGSPSILKKDTPNLVSELRERIWAGVYDWAPMTRALDAARMGLTGLNATSGPNAGFLRPHALLALVLLSNRDDRSTTMDYKTFFNELRPPLPYGDRSWVAQFLGVLPNDPNCKSSKWGYAEPGVNFINFVSGSGGAVESICDGDMRRALTNVKERVLSKITTFFLGAKPIVDSIKVYVNGRVVPKDAVNGWTYDVTFNTVTFHGTEIPDGNSIVHVDFQRDGLK